MPKKILYITVLIILLLGAGVIFTIDYFSNTWSSSYDASIYLPSNRAFEKDKYIKGIEKGDYLELIDVVEIDYDDTQAIEKELDKISNDLARNITREEIKNFESIYKTVSDLRIKDFNYGLSGSFIEQLEEEQYKLSYRDKMYGVWWTIDLGEDGKYQVFEKINLQFVLRYIPSFDFSKNTGDYLRLRPRVTMRIESQETTIYTDNYEKKIEEIPTSNFIIGAGRNFNNGKPKEFFEENIELKFLLSEGELDKHVDVYTRFHLQGVEVDDFQEAKTLTDFVKWSSSEGIVKGHYPEVTENISFIEDSGVRTWVKGLRNDLESMWYGTTHSSGIAKDAVAVAAPRESFMKLSGDYIILETEMSSTLKKDERPIAAQFRYYVSHPLSNEFQQGYRTMSIEEKYKIQ